ncbi:MAG: FKBP-type peptidyl-prolyl cis-trans isomerase [Phycisphaeraceae bacterium]|nr:FKBP-type peptidyl-prolyl cis-trans isomerase [Phycisphaeraceae bacterium]
MRIVALLAWSALLVASPTAIVRAQDRSPLDAAVSGRADKPIAAVLASDDAEIEAIKRMLIGSHRAEAAADRPAMWLHVAPAPVRDTPDALYFEIARDDHAAEPFQQGVMRLMRVRGGIRLRLHSFEGSVGAPLVGMWANPASMPLIDPSSLGIVTDVPLVSEVDSFVGRTPCPYPIDRDGAVEATSSISVSRTAIVFEDEGVDATGKKVWGLTGERAPTFVRRPDGAELPITAEVRENGLTILRMAKPEHGSVTQEEGGEVVVHYTGWLLDGRQFDSSRQPGRELFAVRLPGQVIAGWNEGLKGIARGERRRLIIPPDLAYGVRGRPPVIPPNSTLVFDVECLHVNNEAPEAPGAGGGAGGGQPPPQRPEPSRTGG